MQRHRNGSVVIAIRREGRPFAAIQGDVIEGVVVANRLVGVTADQFRRAAWSALDSQGSEGSPSNRVLRSSALRLAPVSARVAVDRGRHRVLPDHMADKVA